MLDPKRTVVLLDKLIDLGMTDRAFGLVHHFDGELISSHRDYCRKTWSFQPGSNNELVQQRLELMLRGYIDGGFDTGGEEMFIKLAKAAIAEIPKN